LSGEYAFTDGPSTFGKIEFPVSLVRLALARECNISQRHSAAVLLKNYVDTQWSEKSNKFCGPEPPAEVTECFFVPVNGNLFLVAK
jgi:hypothetical protein